MARRSERGAILLNVAIGMMVFIGVTAFVVDHGVMMVGRNQAQNAADAGALAGAVAMAFDANGWTDRTPAGPARTAALRMATWNFIWGQAPDVDVATDVFFTNQPALECPLGANGLTPCIRVNVYRNQVRGNPLPALFGLAFGLANQGVRATATARVAVANASDCMKPWAIPDKWQDNHDVTNPVETPPAWTPDDTFELQGGRGVPLPNPDVYIPPSGSSPGTGFTVAADLGVKVTLKESRPQDSIAPGWYYPVRLPQIGGGVSTGGNDYRNNIRNCNGVAIPIGSELETENGNMIGPTKQGVNDLIALDPNADWNPVTKTVINSCAQASPSCGTRSPRVVAIPIFDTADYYAGKMNGQTTVTIVNILGFFIDDMQGNDVVGYLTELPGLTVGTIGTIDPQAAFLSTIQLIR